MSHLIVFHKKWLIVTRLQRTFLYKHEESLIKNISNHESYLFSEYCDYNAKSLKDASTRYIYSLAPIKMLCVTINMAFHFGSLDLSRHLHPGIL